MNSPAPTHSDPERVIANDNYVAGTRANGRKYLTGSADTYRKYVRPAAMRAAYAYRKYVRPAATHAAAAYRNYVAELAAARAVGPSGAERAAAAAAESAAAYQKYVAGPAAASAAERDAASTAGWSPAVP